MRLPSRYFGRYNPPYVNSYGLREAIRAIDPDIMDYHYRWSRSYNSAFFGAHVPRVMTFHNLYAEGTGALKLLSILNDAFFVRKLRRVDHVLAVSDYVRRQLSERGIIESRITTSYNGVDLHDCRTTDERFVLFIGRLVPTKGLIYLVRAAAEAQVPLKIAGSGPLLARLRKLGRPHGIEVLGGINEQEKERLLSSCTLIALPSLQEAFGIVALEGMAHSKPVVVTDTGGLPEVIGEAGTVVPRKDAGMLARAIRRYWDDPALASATGEAARKRAMAFSWENAAGKMEDVYNSVLAAA